MDDTITRDLLDDNDNVIGQITLPSSTTEAQWTATFSSYQVAPTIPTLDEVIKEKVESAEKFGMKLIKDATIENIKLGITQVGKTKAVSDYLTNVQLYLRTGSLYAAIEEIDLLIQAGIPENLSPFITVDRLTGYRLKITTFLGI